jgi:small nuclear ribonucleoprotein (snRNP)-like protein
MNEEMLEKLFDQTVTIEGLAQNASLGAIVLLDDYTPVYLDKIKEWDKKNDQKVVIVTGILRHKSIAPKATVTSQGEVSHGTDGKSYVLENPEWKISNP